MSAFSGCTTGVRRPVSIGADHHRATCACVDRHRGATRDLRRLLVCVDRCWSVVIFVGLCCSVMVCDSMLVGEKPVGHPEKAGTILLPEGGGIWVVRWGVGRVQGDRGWRRLRLCEGERQRGEGRAPVAMVSSRSRQKHAARQGRQGQVAGRGDCAGGDTRHFCEK